MALSENIDDDSFETAYSLTLGNVPENRLNGEFISTLTRHLVSQLDRAGVPEIRGDRKRSTEKIEAALESIRTTRGKDWPTLIRSCKALRMALEHVLASRTTMSEMPESIRRITKKFSIIPPADTPTKESK